MAEINFMESEEIINRLAVAAGKLSMMRPQCTLVSPRDEAVYEGRIVAIHPLMSGFTFDDVETLAYLLSSSELDRLTLCVSGEEMVVIIEELVKQGPQNKEGPKSTSSITAVLDDSDEEKVRDSRMTLLTSIGVMDGASIEVAVKVVNALLETGLVPGQLAKLCSDLARGIGKTDTSGGPLSGTVGELNADRVAVLTKLGLNGILERLDDTGVSSFQLFGCAIVPVLVLSGRATPPRDGVIHIEERAVAVDDEFNIVNEPDGEFIANYLSQETQARYVYTHIAPQTLSMAHSARGYYDIREVGGRLQMLPNNAGALRQVAKYSLVPIQRRLVETQTKRLEDALAVIARNVGVINPRYSVYSPPGQQALVSLVSFLRDIRVCDEKTFAVIGDAVGRLERIYALGVEQWDKVAIAFEGVFGNKEPINFGTVQQSTGDMNPDVVQNALAIAKPTIKNGDVIEVTTTSLFAKIGGPKGAPMVQIAGGPGGVPVEINMLDPATSGLMLDQSRTKIRNGESNNMSSRNGRVALSAIADCGSALFGAPSVTAEAEYIKATAELHRHKWAKTLETAIGRDEPDRLVTVYDASPAFPLAPAFNNEFQVPAGKAGSIYRVYCKSNEPSKHAAPLTSRFAHPLEKLSELRCPGNLLVVGSSWLDLKATDGYNLPSIQTELVEAAYETGAAALMMLCQVNGEHRSRKAQPGGINGPVMPHPSTFMLALGSCWQEVSFVPGLRPHNGMFWVVASGRRAEKVLTADIHFQRAIRNWTIFYAYFAFRMYRGNAIKNLATLCGVRGRADVVYKKSAESTLGAFKAVGTDLVLWGLKVRRIAAMTHALAVGVDHVENFYGDGVVEMLGGGDAE